MAVKSLHQFFYYHSKYLNSVKCQEISMGLSNCTIQCTLSPISCMKIAKDLKAWANQPGLSLDDVSGLSFASS
jgi:hypothetical protein